MVIQGCIEDVEDISINGNVDVLISEPLGTMLLNERMLETYIIARNKFLKPGGKMFPSEAYLCLAPFMDERLYAEQTGKTTFWDSSHFYGFDLTALKEQALYEKLRQPIIELYDPSCQ
jgi:histone-arginine methyltransferase CARM1